MQMIDDITPDMQQELLAQLTAEADDAIGYYDTVLTAKQSLAIQYYEGRPFGNEVEGRSQYVMPDVAETCDYMLQSIKRTVLQSDAPVEFQVAEEVEEGVDPAESAAQVTKAINYLFMRKQDGDKFVNDTLQAGLIEDIGVAKTVAETRMERKRETRMVDAMQLEFIEQEIEQQDDIEILDIGEPDEQGMIKVKIQTEREVMAYVDIPIPSEEFLFASRTPHEDDSPYLAHRTTKFMSELIEMGFDREQVESLPVSHTDDETDERGYQRWDDEEWTRTERKGAMRSVVLHEEYIRYDVDDDGVAELLQVFRVKNEILSIEEVDQQPFVVWSPFPRAHRMVGNGLAEKVMDIQLVRSMIARNMLDGFAADNYPRPLIDENGMSENTIPDLLNPAPGAPVRYKGIAPTPYVTSFDLAKGASFMEFFSGEKESRTGITRMNQGLDREALNKTASGTAMMMDKGEQFEEYVGGNYANFLAKLFMKKFRLIKENGEKFTMRDGKQVVTVDPAQWGDMEVLPAIGPTKGNRMAQKEARIGLLELQKEIIMNGGTLADEQKMYNLIDDAMGDERLGQADRYFNNPEDADPEMQQEEAPDPEAQKVEAEAMMAAQKLEGEQQFAQAKLQMDQAKAENDTALMWQKFDAEKALAEAKATFEARLAEQKMLREESLAERQMQMNERSAQAKDVQMSKNRKGGSLAA